LACILTLARNYLSRVFGRQRRGAAGEETRMIVCFGSINLDLIFPLPTLPLAGQTVLGRAMRAEPGGKGANQAVAAARDGAKVALAGAVGRDSFAEPALATLRAAGVDLGRVAQIDTSTGCAAICVDAEGRNQIAVASGANLLARAAQVEDALLGPGTTLLLQGEVDLGETASLIHRARAAGARVVLNLAPAGPLAPETLRAVDVLVLNEDETAWLAGHLGATASAAGLHAALGVDVVVTMGERGLAAATRAGEVALPAHRVRVVDTTAAGDCFTGVLAAALDRGLALREALRRANVAAALCCARPGSQGSLPLAAETDAALTG
jgi:ribokinase